MDPNGYTTLLCEASGEFIINKSRFIGYGCPCQTESDALDFLSRIRAKHKDANHNCYAYIIGKNAGIMRYSDDGEPGGTAGMPIIEVMKAYGIVDAAVVVTRYFGGVLLGTGGLVRAYTQGCKTALEAAGIVTMQKSAKWLIEVNYSIWQRLEYYLKKTPSLILDTQFTTTVVATVLINKRDESSVLKDIARLSDGQAELLLEDTFYYPWPQQQQA